VAGFRLFSAPGQHRPEVATLCADAERGCKPKPPKIPSPQLRSAIAQVGGKKELTGRIDVEIEIRNPCARLIANAIIYYNSAILSRLLTKYEASGNAKALALIKKLSPAAWRHIHLNGHYTFRSDGQPIGPGCHRGGAAVGVTEFSGVWAYNPDIGSFGPHALRATAATNALDRGADLAQSPGVAGSRQRVHDPPLRPAPLPP
jgi:Tn3 transposase DDE domain